MMNMKRKAETREKNLQENSMSFEDFDWQKMVNGGTLAKQCVCVLDKFSFVFSLKISSSSPLLISDKSLDNFYLWWGWGGGEGSSSIS